MPQRATESPVWRAVAGVTIALVLAFFFYSLRGLLNPFLLFLLLLLLLSPYTGTRQHVVLVSATGMLTLLWLLSVAGSLLAPFVLALVLAYVLHPLARRLERHMPRTAAVALLAVPLLGVLGLAIGVGIPLLSEQVAAFIAKVPALLQSLTGWVERAQRQLLRSDLPFLDEQELLTRLRALRPEDVIAYLQARQEALARQAWAAILGAGRGLSTVLTILGYVFLTPVLTFYLLRDYSRITARLQALVPLPKRRFVLPFVREYDRLLSRYLRGQLLAAAFVGVMTGVGFALLGFPYALLLGVVAGVFNVVPYLGLIASLVPAVIIALFTGEVLWSFGKIAIVFAVVQTLDGTVVGPRIVGESVGLHPVWVILALALGGAFAGFLGLLAAIPAAVLIKLLLRLGLARYERSRLFRGAAPATPAEDAQV